VPYCALICWLLTDACIFSLFGYFFTCQTQFRECRPSRWALWSSLRSQMELRVLRITFLSSFNLSRSFDFARYITIAEESNIVHMLEVTWSQWLIALAVLCAVCLGFSFDGYSRKQYDGFLSRQCNSVNPDDFSDVSLESMLTVLFVCKLCVLTCFALLCFALLCFALLCFALLCFALFDTV
jgi:hypothetical protein